MESMTKKPEQSKQPKPPKPSRKRKGKNLNVWISGKLRDAIDALAVNNRRPLTEEVAIALENHLAANGLWPPQKDP